MGGLPISMGKAGLALFALGLLLGVIIPRFRNARMALSAHLTAVQMGPTLIAIALFWRYLNVPLSWAAVLIYGLMASSFVLVFGIALAAAVGASEALPIAGKGFNAPKFQERLVTILVRGSSMIMGLCCVGICFFAFANG